MIKRTHTCGELSSLEIGQDIQLNGWISKSRDLGGLIFIDLRALALVGVYMFVFLANKAFQNKSLAKTIFSKPEVFITMINLFFVLNIARAVGASKAVIDSVLGKLPREKPQG